MSPLPAAFDSLKPLGDKVKPITVEEFQARIAHAQELMAQSKPQFDALYLAPGTNLYYSPEFAGEPASAWPAR